MQLFSVDTTIFSKKKNAHKKLKKPASDRYCAIHKNGLGVPCTLSLKKHIEVLWQESLPGLKETYNIGIISQKVYPCILKMDRWTDGQSEIIWQESSLPLSFKIRQMDRQTDRNNLTGNFTPVF